jgi:hypothetical protein
MADPAPRPLQVKEEPSPLSNSGMLTAEKALLSLERICAGFSSGSLGSLGTISAGGSCHQLQSLGSALNVGPSASHSSSTTSCALPGATILSPTRSFGQVSSIPVLSHCQLSPSSDVDGPLEKIKPNDRGIPAAIHDTLGDDLTPGTLHSNSLEGTSRIASEDVPSHTNIYFSDLFSSGLVTPSTDLVARSPTKVSTAPSAQRSATLAPLASHVLRCEMAEHSHRQLPRGVFGKLKVDDGNAKSRMSLSAGKENRISPTTTLRRKKGMVFAGRASVTNTEDYGHHRPPVVQRQDLNTTSSSSMPRVKSSRRPSLIPVFVSRSTLSPVKKCPSPRRDTAFPTHSTLRPAAKHARPNIPSPLRLMQKGVST